VPLPKSRRAALAVPRPGLPRKFRVAGGRCFVYHFRMSESTSEWSRDYRRIERAIAFIEENRERRPDLAEVAGVAGVSEFHFQRLFSRMVGISPKKYEQFLTKEAAKKLLAESESLLDTALDLGLSGPGRLHDLFVSCEAVTPGEFKSRGAGLTISCGFHPSPFGEALLAATPRGLCALYFAGEGGREDALERLREEWANAKIVEDAAQTRDTAEAIFTPARRANAPLTLYLRGTNFQVKVWEALLAIPPGRLSTYEAIARKIGDPSALRAVGSAVGRNPIAFLIPCHRVIRKSGELGGYHWGLPRKRLILAWEAEQLSQAAVTG
jgi:AraC family transcriptional regulator, regulatory protein of adaptative response / methylated-DNA-[protein]-cysteine methyltransferase